jgi:methionyl-tRNA formyltransferase
MTNLPESQTLLRPPLRLVTFNNIPGAFRVTQGWAAQAGHKIVLVVTSPGPKVRRSQGYQEIAQIAGEQNIESASFPWLLLPEVLATARLGAINLHPTLLPAYRGPNALRPIYDGASHIGSTLHWIDGAFDTGRILSQHRVALPRPCTPEAVYPAWAGTMIAALAEGAQKAIAGDPGVEQPEAAASYVTRFSEHEHWLDLTEPAYRVQCKATALNIALF